MGRNSTRRRDAEERRAAGGRTPAGASSGSASDSPGADREQSAARAESQILAELRLLGRGRACAGRGDGVAALVQRLAPLPLTLVRGSADTVVARLLTSLTAAGWCPDDLDQLLLREGDRADRVMLAAWLRRDLRDHSVCGPWREQVERLTSSAGAEPVPGDDLADLAAALHLGALLIGQRSLPPAITRGTRGTRPSRPAAATPTPSAAGGATQPDTELTRKLATVRGLLAKAESTTYDEEAEALSAKAQELISRYALERLLEQEAGGAGTHAPGARRVWLEAPYVGAKAQLVHEVAKANTCRAVLSDPPGAMTVVGDEADLDAVELMATSLLVQAGTAMLRHGRAVDASGAVRTRSFRASFLMAFAIRIGERLTATAEQVLHDSGHESDLLPVLRSRSEAVEEAFAQLVPGTVTRTRSISNAAGWRAGQAAADLAAIDVRQRLAEAEAGVG